MLQVSGVLLGRRQSQHRGRCSKHVCALVPVKLHERNFALEGTLASHWKVRLDLQNMNGSCILKHASAFLMCYGDHIHLRGRERNAHAAPWKC